MRDVDLQLLVGSEHYPAVVDCVRAATRSVWIATANLKDMMVEDARLVPGRRRGKAQYGSVLALLGELAGRGVELRVLHATPPSQAFVRDFDREPRLVAGGLELRLCPRNHLKLVIVDGRKVYFGSANWTGAGLGAKQDDKRNFELGVLSEDERLLDATQALFDGIWRGVHCATCKLRELCPMPLAELEPQGARPATRALVRLKPRTER